MLALPCGELACKGFARLVFLGGTDGRILEVNDVVLLKAAGADFLVSEHLSVGVSPQAIGTQKRQNGARTRHEGRRRG
jgi:hypothetical protein